MINVDREVKAGEEAHAVGGEGRCYRCGRPAFVYQYEPNGDPVTNNRCGNCSATRRRTWGHAPMVPDASTPTAARICKHCHKAPPLLGIWCGPCAIRHNEMSAAHGWTTKEEAEIRIAYFQSLMNVIPELNEDDELLNAYDPMQEDFNG